VPFVSKWYTTELINITQAWHREEIWVTYIMTHNDFDSADSSSSMQDACHIWTQLNGLVAQWIVHLPSVREVMSLISVGNSDFFLCPTLVSCWLIHLPHFIFTMIFIHLSKGYGVGPQGGTSQDNLTQAIPQPCTFYHQVTLYHLEETWWPYWIAHRRLYQAVLVLGSGVSLLWG